MNTVEESVKQFYETLGWDSPNDITEDARKYEDLRKYSQEYVSKCRLRVMEHIPAKGKFILDMASGPIQYNEYLKYSENFEKRYCVDLSQKALDVAKEKLGDHGEYFPCSFFDAQFEENFFDCTISLHTIYHIDKNKQEEAVRKLLKVTKQGKPLIIVYSNPNTFYKLLLFRWIKGLLNKIKRKFKAENNEQDLYFFAYPLKWWNRFSNEADIRIYPWRSLNSNVQKKLIPNNSLGGIMLKQLFKLENRFPNFFVKHFQYPMIVLTKK